MKQFGWWMLALGMSAAACSENKKTGENSEKPELEALKERVSAYEDSLSKGTAKMDAGQTQCVYYAEMCLDVPKNYPESKEAPAYMDRAHMIFSSCNLHRRAVITAEELIREYPSYKNRQMVLISLATAYDIFILPRNKDKVRYYYEQLLKENPDMPKEEREGYEFRLKYIDLSHEELIELQQAKKQNS